MDIEDLSHRYQVLRRQLDQAYAAPVWDPARIDRIAADMVPLEAALAALMARRDGPATIEQPRTAAAFR